MSFLLLIRNKTGIFAESFTRMKRQGTARLWYMFLATAMVSHNIKYAERLHKAAC